MDHRSLKADLVDKYKDRAMQVLQKYKETIAAV
jgi:hypothetical protein